MTVRRCSTLAEYLRETGTSQTAFAKRLGVGQPAVSQWVLRRRVPRWDLALKIVKLTEGRVPLEALLKRPKTRAA